LSAARCIALAPALGVAVAAATEPPARAVCGAEQLKFSWRAFMTKRVSLYFCAFILAFLSLYSSRALAQQPPGAQDVLVEDIEVRGNRRIPRETILYYVQTKVGDRYSAELVRQDFQAILGLGFFDPLRSQVLEDTGVRGGKIIIFQLAEYPIIRDLQYQGLKSATESEILTAFKERRVGVSKESQFDPSKVNFARFVIRDLLAEKGYPDAAVEVEVVDISATSVAVIFDVEEGKRVRIKTIEFVGERDGFSQGQLRGAMKLVKEAGLFSAFTSKDIYHKEKLQDDLARVGFFLGTKGYLQAKIGEPQIERLGEVSSGFPLPIPILRKSGPGLKITVPIEVGRRYTITKVEEKGVTLFPAGVVTAVTGLRKGDIASSENIRKGVYENIKKIYGDRGYIQADANLIPKFIDTTPEEGEVEFTIEVEEGRQFTLHRLEFIGNTNTRDVVLRREVVLNEGDPYSKQLWDLSILRLNQLGLFEEIKDKDAITRTNDRTQEVEIDLQVKEKGRQQIQLNGGVSGIGGSFFGISYSTNNLLGYGESLSFDISAGNRQLYFLAGFTEPYFLGRPISLGFQLFVQRLQFIGQGFNFGNADQFLQASLFGLSSIDADTLFTQRTAGGTVSTSAPLALFTRRFQKYSRFMRIGLSYSLTTTSIEDPKVNTDGDPTNDIPVTFTQPRILTSRITPSLSYNTLNAAIDPTSGQSFFLGFSLAGGILGGDVRTFAPSLEYKFFTPVLKKRSDKPQVLGMRFLAAHIRAFGTPFDTRSLSFVGGVPIFERFFLGGEDTIRGYNIRSISPVVPSDTFLSTRNVVPKVLDAAGNLVDAPAGTVAPSVLRAFTFEAPEGACGETPSANCNVVRARTFFTPIGGDTQLLYNVEYRVPIVGPLTVAAFADVGTSFNARKNKDQIVNTNFLFQTITPGGVVLNPAGRVATQDELQSATPAGGTPTGFRTVFLQGDSRSFDIVRTSQQNVKFLSDLRSSLGAEVRVQVPFINVPFRLIFAYNPNAKTDITDPTVLFLERKTVVRFSVGRTF
jgi:outer membrane protein insertion porin family